MLTIYRGKFPTGGFRIVKGTHEPLSAEAYTRTNYASANEAFESRSTTDAERKAILLIDPDAARVPGKWVRIDKGDGIETEVSRDEVFEKLHATKAFRTGAELRRVMAQLESGRTDAEIRSAPAHVDRMVTNFARYIYRRV